MPVISAAVTIAFTLLAFLCLDLFGFPGFILWLVAFWAFYKGCMALKRHVSPTE